MNRKTLAFTLLLFTASAVLAGSALVATYAADNNSTNLETTPTKTATTVTDSMNGFLGLCGPIMGFDRNDPGRGVGFGGGFNIEISADFVTNLTNIAKNDSGVQNLISQGYNVTTVFPIIKNSIDGNGTFITKATTAIIILQNCTSGFSEVTVDLEQAKVTQIVTKTRTVFTK